MRLSPKSVHNFAGLPFAIGVALVWQACGKSPSASTDKRDGSAPLEAGPDAVEAAMPDANGNDADGDGAILSDSPDGTDTGTSAGFGWLFNPATWHRVDSVGECDVYEANQTTVDWPPFDWTSCGAGCTVALVFPGSQSSLTLAATSAARMVDGRLLLTLSTRPTAVPKTHLTATLELDPDRLLAAVRVDRESRPCAAGFVGRNTSRSIQVLPIGDSSAPNRTGFLPIDPGASAIWPPIEISSLWRAFDIGSSWGGVFDQANIRVALAANSPQLSSVYAGARIDEAVGLGDSVFWIEWLNSHAVIRRWNQNSGVNTLIQGPWDAVNMAIGPARMVWLGAHGTQAADGKYDATELYWTPSTTDPSQVVIHQGPSLPIPGYVDRMAAAGDWAAFPHCLSYTNCGTLVVNLEQSRVWLIPQRSSAIPMLLGMSESQIIVAEGDQDTESGYFVRVLKYDLNQIDAFAGVLQ